MPRQLVGAVGAGARLCAPHHRRTAHAGRRADAAAGCTFPRATTRTRSMRAEVERLRWIGVDVEFWPTERVRDELLRRRAISARVHFPTRSTSIRSIMRSASPPRRNKPAPAFSRTRQALAIDPAGVRKRIDTPGGQVRAAHVVLAGNVASRRAHAASRRDAAAGFDLRDGDRAARPALNEVVRYRGAVSDGERADNHYRIVDGAILPEQGCNGRDACAPGRRDPRNLPRAGWCATCCATIPRSARSRSRISGAARSAARCTACRRSARWSRASGWRAASAATASTPRRWPAS